MLSLALAWAEVLGAYDIFIGVNALDYSGYPDCRPEFIEAFERTAALATKAGVEGGRFRIQAPLICDDEGSRSSSAASRSASTTASRTAATIRCRRARRAADATAACCAPEASKKRE